MDALQQIVLALVQGLTGAAPISGAGHALILTDLLDWPPVSTRTWAPLSFAASLGAGLGLFLSLARDWAGLLRPAAAQARRATLLAAIPPTLAAGFVLPVLHSPVSSAEVACAALIANGALLFLAERRRRAPQATVAALSPARALGIGALEALGLLPGLSRVGLGMAAGGLAGLPYGAGARLALMAATPAALASAAVSLGQARGAGAVLDRTLVLPGLTAAAAAAAGVTLFLRWVAWRERIGRGVLKPFAYYCWAAGGLSLAYLVLFT